MIKVADTCFRCGDCMKMCPVPGTITNRLPGPVVISSLSCIDCKQCLPICPAGALSADDAPVGKPKKEKELEIQLFPQVNLSAPKIQKRKKK